MKTVGLPLSSRLTRTFPFVSLPNQAGRLPVEVCLVAQLSPGSGDKLFYSVLARQREHLEYVDELEEPSAKLHGTDFEKGEATAVYSFGVGPAGHPFHRHAGHRVFTAVAGSSGAQLRFSTASPAEIEKDPSSFLRALRLVNIPADCMFTVRFGGETWHQFMPLEDKSTHPAFFALSCHTNELGGDLSEGMRQKVIANEADIPSLTDLLPESVLALLHNNPLDNGQIPTTSLYLNNKPDSIIAKTCTGVRLALGRLCGAWARLGKSIGFISEQHHLPNVNEHATLPPTSLLQTQLQNTRVHHVDHFTLTLPARTLVTSRESASVLLAGLLDGFVNNPPAGVTRLMQLRNVLVRPLKLRTSSLGCPVSSLLSEPRDNLFAETYPVLAQQVDDHDRTAQVILGANDKHLIFRSCASVRLFDNGTVEFSLSTKVACKNLFGRFYMATISQTHRRYITPTMLMYAVMNVVRAATPKQGRSILAPG